MQADTLDRLPIAKYVNVKVIDRSRAGSYKYFDAGVASQIPSSIRTATRQSGLIVSVICIYARNGHRGTRQGSAVCFRPAAVGFFSEP